ncbi:MAG: response regulator transcription factor [Chloroflexota bacterium]|nr:response regulator transcription factor [Chloroflexota bacterium]
MRVLVIDDSPDLVEVVSICIEMRWPGATVLSASTGPKGLALLASEAPELVVLDIGLPVMDGFQVLKQIRATSQVPVLILTARDADTDAARALEMGADDYVTKPFSHIELLSRINAVLRRTNSASQDDSSPPFEGAGVKVDFARREVWVRGQRVRLTPIEFAILSHLAHNAGKVVTHKELLIHVWGSEDTNADCLKVQMQRLRRKLAVDPQAPFPIQTEWKVGYKLPLQSNGTSLSENPEDPRFELSMP